MGLALTACSSSAGGNTGANDSGKPFRVLYIAGVSGAYATFAGANATAMKASASVINKNGGIGGRQVEVKVGDDRSDPTQAISVLQEALTSSSPPDLVWFSTNDEGNALIPILNGQKILTVTNVGAPLDDAAKYPYTVSMSFDQSTPYVVMRQRLESEGAKAVGFVTTNDGVGQVFWSAFKQAFDGSSIKIYNEPVNLNSLNVTPNMQALQAKHVDHLVLESYTSLTSYIFSARTAAGMGDIPTIGDAPVAQTDPYKSIAAPDRKNVVVLAANLQIAGAENGPAWDTFIAALKANGQISNLQSQATVYTGLQAVAAAAKKAGSTGTPAIVKALRGARLDSDSFVYPSSWQTVSSKSTLLRESPSDFKFVSIAPYNDLGQFPASAVVN